MVDKSMAHAVEATFSLAFPGPLNGRIEPWYFRSQSYFGLARTREALHQVLAEQLLVHAVVSERTKLLYFVDSPCSPYGHNTVHCYCM